MNLDVELVADQPRKLPSANRLAWDQPRNPRSIEVRTGLVVGRPGNAILVGNLGHRGVVDGDTTQHLVLDLHGVARIEELAFLKLWIAHLLGRRIERALFEESIGLCALAVVLRRHPQLRAYESP